MSLITCPECKILISNTTDSCPHCGYNLKKKKSQQAQGIGCLIIIVIFVIIYMTGSNSSDSKKTETSNPKSPEESRKEQAETPLTIGVSYNQIMNYLDSDISMSRATDVRGQPRYMGQTSDYMAVLEIIGSREDVSQATLMLSCSKDAPEALVRNTAILLRFVKNIDSENYLGSDWINSALEHLNQTGEPVEKIVGSKLIKVSQIERLGMTVVTVKHKNVD